MECKNCSLECWYLLPRMGWNLQLSLTAILSIIVNISVCIIVLLARPHQRYFSLKAIDIYDQC